MKNALVIAAREFEEKRFVAYAAIGFAILPFVLAAIPGVNGRSPRDVIALSSLIFGTTFAIAVGAISGVSFIGRDLSDGRMSFYFARPVESLSIWFGKLTASILMIVGTFAVIIVPARLAAGDRWIHLMSSETIYPSLYILGIAIALFLIAHVISTFARSRSPLIVFDFVAAVVCGVVVRLLIVPLSAGGAFGIISKLSIALAIAAAVAVIGGGAWQLERGRTDRRRNHLALSQFLWTSIAVALLIAAAYVAWVVSGKPADLTGHVRGTRSTNGPLAVLTGTLKGRGDYHAAFLLNTEDGSAWRVDPWADGGVRYTRNGRSAVVPRRLGEVAELLLYTRGKTDPVDTGLTMGAGDYTLSDDGGRIATISKEKILSVYDVATKRSLVSVHLAESTFIRVFFVTSDLVRIYFNAPAGLKIMEFDARSRALRETGLVPSAAGVMLYCDPAGAHMLVRAWLGTWLTLNDARTGAEIKALAMGERVKAAQFLRDGRIAMIAGPDSATVLHILAADATPQRDIPLGARRTATIFGDDGTRIILNDVDASGGQGFEAVNITTGVIEHREAINDWLTPGGIDLRPPIQPLREVFYVGDKERIVAWNPATGARRMITGG